MRFTRIMVSLKWGYCWPFWKVVATNGFSLKGTKMSLLSSCGAISACGRLWAYDLFLSEFFNPVWLWPIKYGALFIWGTSYQALTHSVSYFSISIPVYLFFFDLKYILQGISLCVLFLTIEYEQKVQVICS